jgi:predicted GNAT family acetyltransferase
MPRTETARQERGRAPYHLPVIVRALSDVRDFLRRAEPVLMRDEARHNLILGVAGTIIEQPALYPEHHLLIAESAGSVVGAALRTPPFNLILADPIDDDVVDEIADHLAPVEGLPGVVANRPHAERFAARWTALTGSAATVRMSQGVYALHEVRDVDGAPGVARSATESDRPLLMRWTRAFHEEALPAGRWDERHAERVLDLRLSGEPEAGFWIWEDGEPVSLAGFSGPTPNGIRIGPVYTPAERRRRGYATRLVAEMSAHQLAGGRRFCFLYTDLANPTSNAVYERIGYERVCESDEIGFEADPA